MLYQTEVTFLYKVPSSQQGSPCAPLILFNHGSCCSHTGQFNALGYTLKQVLSLRFCSHSNFTFTKMFYKGNSGSLIASSPSSHRRNLFALWGTSRATQDQNADERQQPLCIVPKPDQMSLGVSCLLPASLGDPLLGCCLSPTSNLLSYTCSCTDFQFSARAPLSLQAARSGERTLSLHLSQSTGLPWLSLPPPHKLQARDCLPCLLPSPRLQRCSAAMHADIHGESSISMWQAALKKSYLRK